MIRIKHKESGAIIAEGELGKGITAFEGNFYIQRKLLKSGAFKPNFIPGLCVYKFLYVWMDFIPEHGSKVKSLGWLYWLPNPLFPFIWYRIGIPQQHPSLIIEQVN